MAGNKSLQPKTEYKNCEWGRIYVMAKWGSLEDRVVKCFEKSLQKKGYLSLCSIIESQYYFPRKYPVQLKKMAVMNEFQHHKSTVRLPPKFNIAHFRAQFLAERRRQMENNASCEERGI